MRPVFEVEGLCVDYTTELGVLHAVRNVSLAVHEHESFGLVGESGSGKSTLAMGAIRYLAQNGRVTDGSVRLNGVELLGLSPKALRALWGSSIGIVYQSPLSALNPSIIIGKQLAEVARQHLGMDAAAARDRVTEMLTKVAMPDPEAVMKRYPHQLSGGMLQRCVIAMALMTNPSLLIMDEPTTALDVTTQAVVLDLVAELKREFDSAILYITHDLGVITKICDRVGVMYAGEFMEQAELNVLFKRPLHPYTLDLLGCVPHFDPTPQKRSLVTIPGSIPRVDQLPPGCIFAPRCGFVEEACTTARPPLAEVADAHLSACRRWQVVPPPAEHLRAATEAVRSVQTGCATPRSWSRPTTPRSTSRRRRASSAPSTASTSRCASARRWVSSARAAAARRQSRAPSSASRRRPAAASRCAAGSCRRPPANGRARRSGTSRWSSRTRTPP